MGPLLLLLLLLLHHDPLRLGRDMLLLVMRLHVMSTNSIPVAIAIPMPVAVAGLDGMQCLLALPPRHVAVVLLTRTLQQGQALCRRQVLGAAPLRGPNTPAGQCRLLEKASSLLLQRLVLLARCVCSCAEWCGSWRLQRCGSTAVAVTVAAPVAIAAGAVAGGACSHKTHVPSHVTTEANTPQQCLPAFIALSHQTPWQPIHNSPPKLLWLPAAVRGGPSAAAHTPGGSCCLLALLQPHAEART
jgi:hypothetical protein